MEISFLNYAIIQTGILLTIMWLSGILVIKQNVRVNYTRKINHFAIFFLPLILTRLLSPETSDLKFIASAVITIFVFAICTKPIRSRVSVIATAFASIDRPEDRPNTLLWLTTQTIAAWMVIIPLGLYFRHLNIEDLIFIPVFINGIGDGLAEPVGVRFGKLKYKTFALFTSKRYERSIEGSACVFVVSVLTLLTYRELFTSEQFIVTIIILPIVMTLAEAFSPHTWDTPFLFLTAGIFLTGIQFI